MFVGLWLHVGGGTLVFFFVVRMVEGFAVDTGGVYGLAFVALRVTLGFGLGVPVGRVLAILGGSLVVMCPVLAVFASADPQAASAKVGIISKIFLKFRSVIQSFSCVFLGRSCSGCAPFYLITLSG